MKQIFRSQLIIPILALLLLVIFNLIRDPSFFSVSLTINSYGDTVLSGNLIQILNGASELAILAMGMTLVTAASRGQDISVGAAAAIAGSVFVRVLLAGEITWGTIFLAFFASCLVAMVFGAFNGTLVAVFRIQPMIATLILFTTGRAIAYWINGGATPTVSDVRISWIGGFIPGVPIPTPIFAVIICAPVISGRVCQSCCFSAVLYCFFGFARRIITKCAVNIICGIRRVKFYCLCIILYGFFIFPRPAVSVAPA